ncbi:MAG TPA: DUF1571 domain-containing protein, partial [Pirellulales bacterium]|nr:DUF1571 domain-containing protein [Pirellulales bacterium]
MHRDRMLYWAAGIILVATGRASADGPLLFGPTNGQPPAQPAVILEAPVAAPPQTSPPTAAEPIDPAPTIAQPTAPEQVEALRAGDEAVPAPKRDAELVAVHPLAPGLQLVQLASERLKSVRDYQCLFIRREHVAGKLGEPETIALKVRLEPLAIRAQCMGPTLPRGREVLYSAQRDARTALVTSSGMRARFVGNESLPLDDPRLLGRSRHALNDYGVHRLVADLMTDYQHDITRGESVVKVYRDVKVDGRSCLCIEVRHPEVRRDFRFHVTRAYFDHELELPIRWEAYTWPEKRGGPPVLLEEYTYRKLSLNTGLTAGDFEPRKAPPKPARSANT